MDTAPTAIRGKDWVFNALWASCADKTLKFLLTIPVTFILRDGQPYRGITSCNDSAQSNAQSTIKRLPLDAVDERALGDSSSFRGHTNKGFRLIRQHLIDFQKNNGFDESQENVEEPLFCHVFYSDGEEEDISLRIFDVLLRNKSWRLQVLMLQGSVPAHSLKIGTFQMKSGSVRSLLESDEAGAGDTLAASIARYAEKAYKFTSNAIMNKDELDEIQLKVKELRAKFAVDMMGNFFFLNTEYVLVEIKGSGRKEVEEFIKEERMSRESQAAQQVGSELHNLLSHAGRRGLPLEESFNHFDSKRCGFVDVDALIDGLARLGIGVTYPVGEATMGLIGGTGSTFLTEKDFENFMKSQIDVVIFDNAERKEVEESINHRLAKKKNSTTSISHKDVRGKLRTVTIPNHLKPVQLEVSISEELTADSITLGDTQDVKWRRSNLDPNQSPRLAGEDERTRIRELPVAESAYNTGNPNSIKGPDLKNASQKRALNELRRSQDKWIKKKNFDEEKNLAAGGSGNAVANEVASVSRLDIGTSTAKSGKGKKGAKPPGLNLQTIRQEHLASHFEKSADEVLHIDTGVVMTYRVVRGKGDPNVNKTEEENEDLRYKSLLEVREKNFADFEAKTAVGEAKVGSSPEAPGYTGSQNLANNILNRLQEVHDAAAPGGEKKLDRWVSFTIIVVPDIFQTLDVLQHALEKILVKFPMARVVFCGYPGMPNTLWPENWVLNSDLHAKCIAKLVQFLKSKRIIGTVLGEPTFLVGVGFGAYILSKFVVHYVPLIPWIEQSIKTVILVNGILKLNKSYLRILRDLRTSLLKASKQETTELIVSLHLCDQYLFENDRDTCIKDFWQYRRGIAHSDSSKQPYDESNNTGKNFFGILELLRAILITPEPFDGSEILNSKFPICAVQSTEDIFVDPRNAMHYQVDQLPPERVSVTDVADIFDQEGSVFVAWLRAGHEVLQERTPYLLSLLSSLAQMTGVAPVEAPVDEHKEDSDASIIEGDEFDVLALASKRKKKLQAEKEAKEKAEREEAERIREQLMKKAEEEFFREQEEIEIERLAAEVAMIEEEKARAQRELEEKARLAEEEERLLKEEAAREKEEHEQRAKKSKDDKERRYKLAGERRKRELAAARQSELAAVYEREREIAERKQEVRELLIMRREDSRSKFAAEWIKYMELLEESKRLAKEKAANLHKLRREEALKRVEEKLAMERSARIAERKRKAQAMIDAIISETIELEGEDDGGYELDGDRVEDIKYLIAMGMRLLKDLLHCRQRSVDALKRQMLVEQKYLLFKKQVDSMELELQRLRRAIRLIEINPSLVGTKEKAEMEIVDMKKSLKAKEESYLELQGLWRQREQQFDAANRKVQELKVMSRERDVLMKERIHMMLNLETKFEAQIRQLKMDKENAIVDKDRLRIQDAIIVRRIEGVKRELKRIKDHKGEMVDTDVWVEGVLQRMMTKELRAYLKKECQKEEDLLEECRIKTNEDREKIVMITEKISMLRRSADKIGAAGRSLQRQYLKFSAVSVVEIMKNLADNHEGAEKAEDVRSRPSNLERLIDYDSDSKSALEKLRMKDADIRTKDERKMLGMDMIMHPEAYINLSVVEIESMSFDADYQVELSKPDLERIWKLPERIQLAMPFLHTDSEVTAHRLFNLFLRNMDDNFFKTRDYLSEGADGGVKDKPDDVSTNTSPTTVSHTGSSINAPKKDVLIDKKDTENAEVIHDILVREALRDRLRSIGEGEDLSVQEREWLKIDRIIAPHVYGLEEPLPSDIHQRNVLVDISTSVIKMKKLDKATKPKEGPQKRNFIDRNREGDMYNPMRDRYENGEVIFDMTWECPFTKQELLAIYKSKTEPTDANARKALDLMQKYFVSDDESIMGHNRLQIIWNLTNEINGSNNKIDELIDREIQAAKDAAAAANNIKNAKEAGINNNKPPENDPNSDIKRIWGSSSVVHPACLGTNSQESYFLPSGFNASRDHPASFAIREEKEEGDDDSQATKSTSKMPKEGPELLGLGVKLIKSHPKAPKEAQFDEYRNDPNSLWFICDSIRELTLIEPRRLRGKTVLLGKKDRLTIFELKDAVLQSRQSRSHRFKLPDRADARILDITVSITFQGGFSTKGYRLGRLAAALFRLPDPDKNNPDAKPVPIPVGYAPYSMCSPNLPDVLGRIVIFHRPRARPLAPGEFQLVMGSGSCTKYSIEVHCKYASAALPIVDEEIALAKRQQERLVICIRELEDLSESLRIAERKLVVCHKMITEAETESQRTFKIVKAIKQKIEQDDEEMTMFEEERAELQRELSITEIEYAQWATVSASRVREKEDIKEGIKMMHTFQRERTQEKIKLKEDLEAARRDLPAAIAVIRSYFEAANIAASLNTVVQGPAAAYGASATGDAGGPKVTTPAEDVRRRFKRDGFKNMLLEEQQWLMLDMSFNHSKYEWLREQQEQEDQQRIARGKKPKVRKYSTAIEAYRYNKAEIETILITPFSLLTRQEMCVRKILTKFHDNPEIMKKQYAIAAYGFDPHLAERTRSKNPKAYTKEEKEWESIDRRLHPEVWKYYVNSNDFKNLDLRGANAESTFGKQLGSEEATQASSAVSNIDNSQAKNLEKMGKLLGMDNASITGEATSIATEKLSLAELSTALAGKQNKAVDPNEPFKCPYSKDKLFKIWRTPRHKLKDEDELKTYQLLLKYNGTYGSYMEMQEQSRKRQANAAHAGSHVKWDGHGKLQSTDIDFRGRELLREIDRATYSKNEWMSSGVLHGNDQKFPTRVLRMHLEEMLDTLLMEQIKERERADRKSVDTDSDSEEDNGEDDDLDVIVEDEGDEMELQEALKKRAKKRAKRRLKLKKSSEEENVLKAKKKLVNLKNKTGQSLVDAILQNQLGPLGCLACRKERCCWAPTCDMDICTERKRVLDREIERVKLDKESHTIESTVCLSAQLGGNTQFKRLDLLEELQNETEELERRMHLNCIDKELHDAYASRQEYMEVKHLHGYAMMLWINNARQALQARQSRMVAVVVAKEICDDILDWMLDGWFFGERESTFNVAGNVPSIKKNGVIKSGQDQINAVGPQIAKMKKRSEAEKKGIVLDEAKRGLMKDKSKEVEDEAQMRLKNLKVARDGNAHEHNLNETESTLKFGLFMLTLMYFRAMVFLRREKRSWSGEDDAVGKKGNKAAVLMSEERMRMLDEENKAASRKKKIDAITARVRVGEQRKKEREAAERREAIFRLQSIIKRQQQETGSICIIQRIFRGHLGRKAAGRWALKRAELGAMNALMNAAATFCQRHFRGYRARCLTIRTRMEMAQFISLMRAQEAASDESVYWETHPWQRFKRDFKDWQDKKFRKAHQTQVLGGARLTEEEQERMLGTVIEEVDKNYDDDSGEENDVDQVGNDADEPNGRPRLNTAGTNASDSSELMK